MDRHTRPAGHNPDELPEELLHIARLYATQPVPQPTRQQTEQLVEQLLDLRTAATPTYQSRPISRLQIMLTVRWQLRLLGPWFWIVGVLLLMAGFVLAPTILGGEVTINLLIILSPFTTILGVIHAIRTLSLRVHEIEASCPTNIIEAAAGLVLAIICFNVLLGLIATTALALAHWVAFGMLLTTWLGPLLLLVGLSLPVALRWGTLPAIFIGGGPWLLFIGLALLHQSKAAGHASLLIHGNISLLLSGLSALVGLSLLLLLFLQGGNWQHYLLKYQ